MVRWIREEEKLRGFWSGSEILLHTLINKLMNTYTAHIIEFQSPKNLDTAPPTFFNLSRSFVVVWLSNYHFLSCYLSVHSHSLGPGYIARLLWPYWNKKYGPFLKYWLYSSSHRAPFFWLYCCSLEVAKPTWWIKFALLSHRIFTKISDASSQSYTARKFRLYSQ